MNIGEGFRNVVQLLYAGPTARVVVNAEMGEEFRTEGGVRQGCPLSALLFIIVLELMAIEMRESEEIEGIKMAKEENRKHEKGRRGAQREGRARGRVGEEGGEEKEGVPAQQEAVTAALATMMQWMKNRGADGAKVISGEA